MTLPRIERCVAAPARRPWRRASTAARHSARRRPCRSRPRRAAPGPAGARASRRRSRRSLRRVADDTARAIAVALREGFDRHYALFRDCARAAKRHFETGNWRALRHVARDRIDYYDRRVVETVDRIEREFRSAGLDGSGADALWERVKLHYIGLLIDHKQPECAETFFNSVSCKILHRTYFHNRFIFVRPSVSTEHIEADPPTYRSYYPLEQGARNALIDIVLDFRLETRFADFRRDLMHLLAAFRAPHAAAVPARGQPPDPGAVDAVLSRPDRLRRRPRRERHA